jgi:L-fuculose-phosphate aldolase
MALSSLPTLPNGESMQNPSSMMEHPRDELVRIMIRMYRRHLTTSSGGNASIHDAEGTVWMTPKGNDKGALLRHEMAYRPPFTTTWQGPFPPSSEVNLHLRLYQVRPDAIRAVLHAHSQSLVAFATVQRVPATLALSQAAHLCGLAVGWAPYAIPGSEALAEACAQVAATHDCILLEHHGIVVVGSTLSACYAKFEALEFCARAQIRASVLGGELHVLAPADMQAQALATQVAMRDITTTQTLQSSSSSSSSHSTLLDAPMITTRECELRATLVRLIRRAYEQGLVHSQAGALSARLSDTAFLMTPRGCDRSCIQPEDIVRISFDSRTDAQAGHNATILTTIDAALPSRAWSIHNAIYQAFPTTYAIVHAHPFHISAFCMTSATFATRVLPESYIVLRNVGAISFRDSLHKKRVVAAFAANEPCTTLLLHNDGALVQGESLEQVFDRLEVLEATANVILEAKSLGGIQLMSSKQIQEIDEQWFSDDC